jgi:hypothetical protein
MLRMPLSVKSRFRKRLAGAPFTTIAGTRPETDATVGDQTFGAFVEQPLEPA